MGKVNMRKAASYVAKANKGENDINVAEALEDFTEYLLENHEISEIIAMLEDRM